MPNPYYPLSPEGAQPSPILNPHSCLIKFDAIALDINHCATLAEGSFWETLLFESRRLSSEQTKIRKHLAGLF
ncbi:hypothetical protein WKK05_34930 [Nostoc sp. UHCC 0302]|uniref:hypothetical protein n=1 Tax=Nostoc sp. UHCC 0302 TaxID=3134896 RepID=UPI00311CB1A4